MHVGQSLKGEYVVIALNRIIATRYAPLKKSKSTMAVNSSPKPLIGGIMSTALNLTSIGQIGQQITPRSKVLMAASQWECLNQHGFLSLDDARSKIDA
jgi:hypothetical protein